MAGFPVKVGDSVTVPGDMYGTVKFIGPVANKNGVFAGVQLATEFAPRGKNSGDVEGRYYFKTTIPGAGIFLPVDKAIKRNGATGMRPSTIGTPGTPTRLTSFNVGGRTPAPPKANFSQSVSAAGRASPALKPPVRRESLPRPQSPLRKVATPGKGLVTPRSRPGATNLAKSQIGGPTGYRSGGPKPSLGGNKFSQSLRAASTASNFTAHSGAESSLGLESSFDEVPEEEGEDTPTPTPHVAPARKQSDAKHQEELSRLRSLLDEKDRALRDQNSSVAEMERNLNELSKLVPQLSEEPPRSRSRSRLRQDIEDEDLPRDVAALRAALREKNEKIKLLTAEFDNNRADFRSTIDTLEMASTETERVYEKRVDELLEEVRNLQDRSEDVESVALQLKQLEELVQELEEGLEDARRGEAEARGEVEFLRGEVERSRSELRRERERKRTEEQLNGYSGSDGGGGGIEQEKVEEMQSQLESREDEIRGLKTIIRNLQLAEDTSARGKPNGASGGRAKALANGVGNDDANDDSMQQHIRELEDLLQQKTAHEQELEKENSQLRNSVHLGRFPIASGPSAFGLRTGNASSRPTSRDMLPPLSPTRSRKADLSEEADKHISTGTQGSQRTVVLSPATEKGSGWQDTDTDTNARKHSSHHRQQSADTDIQAPSEASSAALWCEICEEGGHDILSCKNMLGSAESTDHNDDDDPGLEGSHSKGSISQRHERNKPSESMPKPLSMSRKSTREDMEPAGKPPDAALPAPPTPNTTIATTPKQPISRFDDDRRDEEDEEEDDDDASDKPVTATQTPALTPSPTEEPADELDEENKKKSEEEAALKEEQRRSLKMPIEGTGAQAGMWAGKTSGVIDPDKWCALCERDGHESVDCPIEDAF